MLHYHNMLPYYRPQPRQPWPDSYQYAKSEGYPVRDSTQISPRQDAPFSRGSQLPLVIAVFAVLLLILLAVAAYFLLQDDPEPEVA